MSTNTNSSVPVYTQGFGTASLAAAFVAAGAPAPTNITGPNGPFKIGQIWVDSTQEEGYILVGLTASNGTISAVWEQFSASGGFLETLTGNSGVATPIAGNINTVGSGTITTTGSAGTLTISSTAGAFPITPFVVGPSGRAGYQTVQAAITAANTAGGGTVYIQPGTYTENLTIYTGIYLVSIPPDSENVGAGAPVTVHVVGNHTLVNGTASKTDWSVAGIFFSCSTGNLFSSVLTIALTTSMAGCTINANAGFIFAMPDLAGSSGTSFTLVGVYVFAGGTFSSTAPGNIYVSDSALGTTGSSTLTLGSGVLSINFSTIAEKIANPSGILVANFSNFQDTITASSGTSAAVLLNNCTCETGLDACVVFNGTAGGTLSDSSFSSTATYAIDGTSTGVINMAALFFNESDSVNPALTGVVLGSTFINGRLSIGTAFDDPRAFSTFSFSQFDPTTIWGLQLTGTLAGTSSGSAFSLFDNTVLTPTSSSGTLCGFDTNVRFYPPVGVTTTLAAGIYSSPFVDQAAGTITTCACFFATGLNGPLPGGGVLTNAYGGYFSSPNVGTNQTALYADNISSGVPANGVATFGTFQSAPPNSATATDSLGTITFGNPIQNVLGYDIIVSGTIDVTAATTATITLGVDSSSTPAGDPITPSLTAAGGTDTYIGFSAYVPAGYYLSLASTGGSITVGSVVAVATPV